MLTATCEPTVAKSTSSAQIETLPSDLEISQRVLRIRSSWSISERIRRRHEAEQRFADLLDQLVGNEAA